MATLFSLSVHDTAVRRMLSGGKRWEFRRNPRFGTHRDAPLSSGDTLLLVSTFPGEDRVPLIRAVSRVGRILRSDEMLAFFGDPATGRWKEAGCAENTDRDWDFFATQILGQHAVAIELEVFPVVVPLDLGGMCHRQTRKVWKGTGLVQVGIALKDHEVNGLSAHQVLADLARGTGMNDPTADTQTD